MDVQQSDRTIHVRIDSSLRARLADLDTGLASQVRDYLTVTNQKKIDALRRGDWGAQDMPDTIELWRHVGEDIIMPRGFASTLRAGVEHLGGTVRWDDQTSVPAIQLQELAEMRAIDLRPEQEAAARELIRQRQGVLQAPTGGGKTIVGLDVFRRVGLRGMVLVNNIGLAEQWRERAREHLGIEAGLIGDGVWDERPLTIALLQTLYNRIRNGEIDLGPGWWARWGLTIFDEAHHITASTYREILEHCTSRYLIGKTATPLDSDWRRPILEAMIGPVVHRMGGDVLSPTIQIIKTDFRWVPDASEAKLVDTKAIYRHIIKALEEDQRRIDRIARSILAQPEGSAQLIVCKRLGYLKKLRDRLEDLGYDGDAFFMRGSESRQRRAEIAALADNGCCAIFSTVADEGIDIPRLDRIHLPWPARKADPVIQQIGRILRKHPHKLPPVAIDYGDPLVSILRSQLYARINNVYKRHGWQIEIKETS